MGIFHFIHHIHHDLPKLYTNAGETASDGCECQQVTAYLLPPPSSPLDITPHTAEAAAHVIIDTAIANWRLITIIRNIQRDARSPPQDLGLAYSRIDSSTLRSTRHI